MCVFTRHVRSFCVASLSKYCFFMLKFKPELWHNLWLMAIDAVILVSFVEQRTHDEKSIELPVNSRLNVSALIAKTTATMDQHRHITQLIWAWKVSAQHQTVSFELSIITFHMVFRAYRLGVSEDDISLFAIQMCELFNGIRKNETKGNSQCRWIVHFGPCCQPDLNITHIECKNDTNCAFFSSRDNKK